MAATPDRRARLIKLIHVARRELAMDEGTYRALLHGATSKASTAEMSVAELERVLDQAKRAGFAIKPKGRTADRPSFRTPYNSPEASKARALWLFLYLLGAVRVPEEAALAAYCVRITRVADLRWLNSAQMTTLIESLKKWAMRYLPAAIQALMAEIRRRPDASADMRAACEYAGRLFATLRPYGFDLHWTAWERLMRSLDRPVNPDLQALSGQRRAPRQEAG